MFKKLSKDRPLNGLNNCSGTRNTNVVKEVDPVPVIDSLFQIIHSSQPIIEVGLLNGNFRALIDTGATLNIISSALVPTSLVTFRPQKLALACQGFEILTKGTCDLNVQIGSQFYVISFVVVENLGENILIGHPFLLNEKVIIDYGRSCLYIGKTNRQTLYWLPRVKSIPSKIELPKLSDDAPLELNRLLHEFSSLFEVNLQQPTTRSTMHRIVLKENKIIRKKCYPFSPSKKKLLYDQVAEMLEAGVIEPSNSPYSSPPVLIERPGKKPRFCVDFREINTITADETSSLPRIQEAIKDMGNAKFFSTLDLKAGYWQVPMDPESKKYTAFCTPDGAVYHFTVMPFGLKGAPSTFQKLMIQEVLYGYLHHFSQAYLDDVIVYSETFEEHLHHLRLIFERFQLHNLKVSPEKCTFFSTSLDYLGHHIEGNFTVPQFKHIDQIQRFPEPKTKKQLQSFLGTCNWLREYVPNLAKLLAPLTDLLQKNKRFVWQDYHSNCFQEVKSALSKPVSLSRPDFSKVFILQTDASSVGMAAVLYQEDDNGKRFIISHASAKFSKTTSKYHINEQECLSVVWSTKIFRNYLEDKPFILRTDSRALLWLDKFKDSKAKLTRWALLLQEFSFTIEHIPSSKNELPDLLSRDPENIPYEEENRDRLLPPEVSTSNIQNYNSTGSMHVCNSTNKPTINIHDLFVEVVNEQKSTLSIQNNIRLLISLQDREPNTSLEKNLLQNFVVSDDLLWRKNIYGDRLVVPKKIQTRVVYYFHDTPEFAHPGIEETLRPIALRFFWPKMHSSVKEYVNRCIICSRVKGHQKQLPAPMTARIPTFPFQMLSIDILGPFPTTSRSKRFILLVVDVFSKWVEAKAFSTILAKDVVKFLEEDIFSRYGCPETIVSDNGSQFSSALMKRMCEHNNISQIFSSVGHQRANPVERRVQEFKKIFRVLLHQKRPSLWDEVLPLALTILRSRKNRATNETPAQIVLGYELPLPGDWQTNYPKIRSHPDFILRKSKRLKALERQKVFQNKYHRPEDASNFPIQFNVGDNVNVRQSFVTQTSRPFQFPWCGPFKVHAKTSDTTYEIEINNKITNIHVDDLRPAPVGNYLPSECESSIDDGNSISDTSEFLES